MPFSLYAAQEAQKQSSGEIWAGLITMRNPGMSPLRFAVESDPVVSRTNTYVPQVADIQAPDEVAGQPSQGQVVIQAVDREILDTIDSLEGVILFDLELVVLGFPDDVVRDWMDLRCEGVQSDGQNLVFPVRGSRYWEEMAPWLRFVPAKFPGLFPGSRGIAA